MYFASLSILQGLAGTAIDISGLQYETMTQDANTASVRIHGEIREVGATFQQSSELDDVAYLVHENGKWGVCISSRESAQAPNSPNPPPVAARNEEVNRVVAISETNINLFGNIITIPRVELFTIHTIHIEGSDYRLHSIGDFDVSGLDIHLCPSGEISTFLGCVGGFTWDGSFVKFVVGAIAIYLLFMIPIGFVILVAKAIEEVLDRKR